MGGGGGRGADVWRVITNSNGKMRFAKKKGWIPKKRAGAEGSLDLGYLGRGPRWKERQHEKKTSEHDGTATRAKVRVSGRSPCEKAAGGRTRQDQETHGQFIGIFFSGKKKEGGWAQLTKQQVLRRGALRGLFGVGRRGGSTQEDPHKGEEQAIVGLYLTGIFWGEGKASGTLYPLRRPVLTKKNRPRPTGGDRELLSSPKTDGRSQSRGGQQEDLVLPISLPGA